MDDTIDYSNTIKAIENIADNFREFFKQLGEIIGELAEKIGGILRDHIESQDKPKYKLVKSLIKPYKQPFIKIKAKARSNL